MVIHWSGLFVRIRNKMLNSQGAVTHLFTLGMPLFLLVISTVPLTLAACREAFTPPTGPGAGVWHHLESTICFFTNPTHCQACTICCRNAVSHHRHHHKPRTSLSMHDVCILPESTLILPSPIQTGLCAGGNAVLCFLSLLIHKGCWSG